MTSTCISDSRGIDREKLNAGWGAFPLTKWEYAGMKRSDASRHGGRIVAWRSATVTGCRSISGVINE